MGNSAYKEWNVIQVVELGASATDVWKVVGGFFTIHLWHPDIQLTEVIPDQTREAAIRRLLTFPEQPKTTEELILMDNENLRYRYKWQAGEWGERVKNYVADLRVLEIAVNKRSIVRWSSTFSYTEDAVSEFYWNGFRRLQEMFPIQKPCSLNK
jgi:hypothetical protein